MNSPSPVAQRVRATLAKRYRRERRFRFLGLAAVVFGVLSLGVLFADIFAKGIGAFRQAYVRLDVHYDPEVLGLTDPRDPQALAFADFEGVLRRALAERFPEVSTRRERRALRQLVSPVASYLLAERLAAEPALLGRRETLWLPADDDVDTYLKLKDGAGDFAGRLSEGARRWVEALAASGDLRLRFNREFFTRADSREPEMAGIWGAVKGSFYTLLVTLAIAFPLGVAAALYLEEFAPRNRVTDLIEVNINNLAAVPSVIFGLLGLAIFINFLEVPRSTPLVGGMVLALMTLPTVIIASRVAIQAVPPSIREAALAVGASPVQVALHHVCPWPCRASSRAPSSAWRERSARRRPC
ncbi:MAG: phosphate transport system permease protein PstA [Porticoccaceae bacterium]|nr:MAG: phosphate transport system permease protein PstA [Porticoccaceae bacterium]